MARGSSSSSSTGEAPTWQMVRAHTTTLPGLVVESSGRSPAHPAHPPDDRHAPVGAGRQLRRGPLDNVQRVGAVLLAQHILLARRSPHAPLIVSHDKGERTAGAGRAEELDDGGVVHRPALYASGAGGIERAAGAGGWRQRRRRCSPAKHTGAESLLRLQIDAQHSCRRALRGWQKRWPG